MTLFLVPLAAQNSTPAASSAPLSVKVGGFDFTPGGFIDFITAYRSTNVGSGIGTNFANIPYNNKTAGQLSELRLSMQNSRLTLKVAGEKDGTEVTGYLETDFLGTAPGNLTVSSNSNTLRMRVFFMDLRHGAWEMLAGQDWSLLTPNRAGLSPMPSDIFYSQAVDTNYLAGLTWARQPQFRLIYHAAPHWTGAVSVESSDPYAGGSGAPAITLPGGASGPYAGQVDSGSGGGGTPGFTPDVIAKVAYDSAPNGRGLHLEVAGLSSTFRVLTPATGISSHASGGGLAVDANWAVTPSLHLVANTLFGDGAGRYFFGMAPDMIVRQDGTIALVHTSGGLGGLEWQVTPAQMIYAYYGGIDSRPAYDLSGATPVGYGYPGSGNSFNRTLQEATLGLLRTFWKSPQYGAVQLNLQASYVTRRPFEVTSGPKNAHTGMAFLDLRYTLP